MRRPHPIAIAATLLVGALLAAPRADSSYAPTVLCTLPPGKATLAVGVRHGLAAHLAQYPDLTLARAAERQAAEHLLARLRATTARWRDIGAARRSGFDTRVARRGPGDVGVGWLHAEHRRFSADDHVLDPRRPEALIYATQPGSPPTLVGAMFSVRRGVRGPTPAGPIGRWHSHVVCVRKDKRGLAPRANGTCPAGARKTQGSEMLHVWFTHDLRSAYAVHAPVPELCRDRVLSPRACAAGASGNEM